jgi:multisubunit Na+/H+ antiporter MnhB subunit
MNDTLFSLASLVAPVGWLGLGVAAALPAGPWRARLLLAAGRVVPVGLCLLYGYLLVAHWGSAPGGGFSSLSAVITLFASPGKVLGGWVHFLAFDLLVGRWLVDDTLAKRLPRLTLLWVLPATFMYGPVGVLLYLLGGWVLGRLAATRVTPMP